MPDRAPASPARSPVDQLLCACAFPDGDPTAATRIRLLPTAAIDWETVPSHLVRHGLTVLSATHLAMIRDRIPEPVWTRIQANALLARAAALAMSAELLRLLRQLADRGVEVLPFKGPLLGLDAYRDLGARPFVDLDLLVRPRDLDAATAALEALGYQSRYRFTPARDRWFRHVDGDYPLVHPDTGVLIELHARAVSHRFGSGLDTTDLWQRRRVVEVREESVAVLDDDDLLYLYMVHGAKHRWERLEWLASTAALLKRRAGRVATLLRAPYVDTRSVLLACLLARDLLAAPIDDAAAAAIAADPVVQRLAGDAREHMFESAPPEADDDTAAKLGFNLRLQQGVGARLRYVYRWSLWPSPEDWTAVGIPDPLFFVYRLVRPLRLLWRYAQPTRGGGAAPGHG